MTPFLLVFKFSNLLYMKNKDFDPGQTLFLYDYGFCCFKQLNRCKADINYCCYTGVTIDFIVFLGPWPELTESSALYVISGNSTFLKVFYQVWFNYNIVGLKLFACHCTGSYLEIIQFAFFYTCHWVSEKNIK